MSAESLSPREVRLCREAYQLGAVHRQRTDYSEHECSHDPWVFDRDRNALELASQSAVRRYPMPTEVTP